MCTVSFDYTKLAQYFMSFCLFVYLPISLSFCPSVRPSISVILYSNIQVFQVHLACITFELKSISKVLHFSFHFCFKNLVSSVFFSNILYHSIHSIFTHLLGLMRQILMSYMHLLYNYFVELVWEIL